LSRLLAAPRTACIWARRGSRGIPIGTLDRGRAALALAAFAAIAAGPAAADSFVLRDGRVVEGQVLRTFRDGGEDRPPDRWEVRTAAGVRVVLAAEVREHRPRKEGDAPWPWEDFEQRFAFVDAADAEDNFLLGTWAREQGLEAEAVRAFRRAVAADPEHARARTALGYQKVDGRWRAPEGAVDFPEDRGEALPPAPPGPVESALGRVFEKRRSANFLVESPHLDQRALGRCLDALERAREAALSRLGDAAPAGEPRTELLLVADRAQYARAIDILVAPALEKAADRDRARRELALYRAGHLACRPAPARGVVALGLGEGETADHAFLAHFAVHGTWTEGTPPRARHPDWLREAFAYDVLNEAYPDDPTWCVAVGYGRADKVPPAWRNARNWPSLARALAASGRAIDTRDLAVLDLNSLSFDALVQSWSVLRALREEDENGTRAFLRRVRQGTDQFEALRDCLRLTPEEVDRIWKTRMAKGR